MSHSNRHQFVKLEKNTKPFTGQRIARVIAKADKEGKYSEHLTESLAVSIPVLAVSDLSEHLSSLMPHLLGLVHDTQDKIISELRKQDGRSEISDDDISVKSVIEYLDSSVGGSRVTSEYLQEWFKETYSVQAAEFIIVMCKWSETLETLTVEQQGVVEQKINVLSGMFAGFASGKFKPQIPQCKAMVKFAEFVADSADARLISFAERAARIQKERELELSADALGF